MDKLQQLIGDIIDKDTNKIRDFGLLWRITSQDFIERSAFGRVFVKEDGRGNRVVEIDVANELLGKTTHK
jgi:hypothetical protein